MASEKRERGEGRIFMRGNVAWIQYYDSRGQQMRESTHGGDEKKAAKLLRKRLGEVAAGIVPDRRNLRYQDLRDSYMTDCENAALKSLRHDSQGKPYLESVRRTDEFFEGYRAVEIDTDALRKFQRKMKADGLSNGSVNRSMASLRKMFTLAARDGKLKHLPFFPMLPESKPRKGTLPHDKYVALLQALPDYLRLLVGTAFHTGMRLSEIQTLTWRENINWIDKIIRIEDSKNDDPREIPFSGELEAMLRDQYAKRQEGCDRVCFRIDRRGHAQPIGNFRKPWRRACVRLGLGSMQPVVDAKGEPVFESRKDRPRSKPKQKLVYTGLIFHDLRRTFITDAENSGAPRHEVMMVSGHRTESVYKRYAIGNRDRRREVVARIEDYRSKKFGDNSGTIEESPKVAQPVVN